MVSVNSQAARQLLLSLTLEGLHPATFQQLTDLCESCALSYQGCCSSCAVSQSQLLSNATLEMQLAFACQALDKLWASAGIQENLRLAQKSIRV